jgi:tetratricopeptide (TPR) repeat protein
VGSASGDCDLVIGKQETNAVVGAKSAAQKALDIDDSLGEAHLALARVIQLYDWDWPRVEQEYRRALTLNQNDALAHGLFGEFLQEMGRNQEALAEFRRGAALDPLNAWRGSDCRFCVLYGTSIRGGRGRVSKGARRGSQRCGRSHGVGLGLWPKEDVRTMQPRKSTWRLPLLVFA